MRNNNNAEELWQKACVTPEWLSVDRSWMHVRRVATKPGDCEWFCVWTYTHIDTPTHCHTRTLRWTCTSWCLDYLLVVRKIITPPPLVSDWCNRPSADGLISCCYVITLLPCRCIDGCSTAAGACAGACACHADWWMKGISTSRPINLHGPSPLGAGIVMWHISPGDAKRIV
jgi:hypothetical protein